MATREFGTLEGDVTIVGRGTRPATYSGEPDTTNTLCYYRFASNQSWRDQTKAVDLTPVGDPVFTADGAAFDGNDDARGVYGLQGKGLTEVTMEAWAYAEAADVTGTHRIFSQYYNLVIYFFKGGGLYYVRAFLNQIGGSVTLSHQVAAGWFGSWHHVAATFERDAVNGFKLWIDGVLEEEDDTADADFASNDTQLGVACRAAGAERLTGSVDQARLTSVLEYVAAFSPVRTVVVGGRIEVPASLNVATDKILSQRGCGELAIPSNAVSITNSGDIEKFNGMVLRTLE